MADHDNTNRGAIWKNKDKEKDTHPDFTGKLNVNGVEFWVSAWRRKDSAPATAPALSFSIKPKEDRAAAPKDTRNTFGKGSWPNRSLPDDMQDDIPF